MGPEWKVRDAATSDLDALVTLAADVIASRPAYAPGVGGRAGAADWLSRKRLDWARVVVVGGEVLAHVGARAHQGLPDGSAPPPGHDVELCRLMVHPRCQRQGVASMLVDQAQAEYGERLWATATPGGPSHRLLVGRGWADARDAWFPDEGALGRVVVSRGISACCAP